MTIASKAGVPELRRQCSGIDRGIIIAQGEDPDHRKVLKLFKDAEKGMLFRRSGSVRLCPSPEQ